MLIGKKDVSKFKLVDTYNPSTSTASDIRVLKDGVALVAGTDYNLIETSATDGTFTIEIAKLDAVPYQLTYTTSLSPEEEASVDNVNNSVSITYDNGSENTSHNIATPKIKVPKRVAEFNKNLDNDSNPLISWEIRVNTDRANKWANMINPVITDDIPVDQRLIQDSFVVTRVNGPVLTETDYVLTTSDNQFTIDLPDGPYEYTITYDTEILVYPSAHDTNYDRYTNRGTLTTDNYPEKVFTAHQDYFSGVDPNDILTKSAQQSDETENIVWKLVLNPDGLTIANYKIVDTLTSSNHTFVEDSVIVTDEAGNDITEQYDIAFDIDESERSRLTITPKEVNGESPSLTAPIGVQYDTRLNPDEIGSNITVSNSASLWGGDKGNINEGEPIYGAGSQWSYGGGGTGRTLSFTLEKTDPSGQPIPEAVFTFMRVLFDGTEETPIGGVVTIGDDGTINISGARAGRYKVTETSVPEGYDRYEGIIYLEIGYADPNDESVSTDYTVFVTDENWNRIGNTDIALTDNSADEGTIPLLSITNDVIRENISATKNWVGEGSHPVSYLQLQRSLDGINFEAVGEPKSVGGSSEASQTVTWENMEKYQSHGVDTSDYEYTYRVVEVDLNGNPFVPEGYVKVEDGLTVTNTAISEFNVPTISASKLLTGRQLRDGEFTFVLSDANGEVTTATNNAEGEISFEDFLTQAQIQGIVDNSTQTFDFTISEQAVPAVAGVTHDTRTHSIQLVANYSSTTNNITYSVGGSPVIFRNTYEAGPITTSITVSKTLNGQSLEADQFTFELLDSNNVVIDTATNDENGNVVFTQFATREFTSVGTYNFTVREQEGSLGGITYDSRELDFTVEVSDDGNGVLAANVNYVDGPIEFTNTYIAEPVEVEFEVTKELSGQTLRDNQFSFSLVQDEADSVQVLTEALIATNNSDGTIDFDLVEFTEVGTYNFIISEVEGSQGGITYDNDPVEVQVVVTDNGVGNLLAQTTYADGDISFENIYEVSPVEVDFSAHKTLTGQALSAEQFVFTLSADNDAALGVLPDAREVSNALDGTVDFAPVVFTQAGSYAFRIDEVDDNTNGITSDERVYSVTVTVTDNGEGELLTEVDYDIVGQTGYDYTEDTAHFTNTYAATPTSLVLEASKVAEHLNLNDNEFTFVLTGDGVSQEKPITGAGTVIFDELVFEDEDPAVSGNIQTHEFTISEVDNGDGGVTYDATEFTVTVEVTDNGEGSMVVTGTTYAIGGVEVDEITFTNTYSAAPTSVTLEAFKAITGKVLNAGDFTFVLAGDADQSKTNNADGTVRFDAIEYAETGTYEYTINETPGDTGGVTYDDTEYIVTVEVVDNGEGQLVATVDYSIEGTEYGANVANFSNRYDVTTPVDVVLDVNKVADHEYLDNNTFTFTLTDGADLSETVSITGGGLVSFPALTYVDEDLTVHNNVQEYTYTITEENAGDGGVTYDAQPVTVTVVVQDNGEGAMEVVSVTYVKDGQSTTENATFTNTYLAAPVTIDLAADKTLTGQVLEDGQFTFELSGDGIDTQTKTNNQNGVVDFDEITYTEVGTHTYTISEVAGNAGGMAYDETVYTVTVVVTDDQEGQLLADVTYSVGEEVVETASFNNAYTATDVTLDLEVNKVADHEYLQDNEFTFVLTGEGLEDEKSVTGTGSVSFDTITYTDEDLTVHNNVQEYTYTITEVNSGDGGVTYDVQPVTVEVVVQDNGQGAMEVVSITYTKNDVEVDNATFTNTYLAAPVTIDLAADKTLTGQVLEADQFTFELVGDTTDTQTKTNDVDGVVDFDEITYTEVGTHTYTISEVAGDAGGMAYDETVYTVTVVVTDDQEGQLLADITYSVGEDEVETASFNNAYTSTDVTLDLEVNKVADHEYLQDNEFTFVLTGEGIVDKKSVTGTDSVNFDTITYTDEDLTVHDNIQEYTYTITEVNAGDGGVTYDAQPVTVTVVVRDNGEGAMVVDSVTYTKDDVEVENATFTNTYQAAPVSTAIEVSKDLTGGKPLEAEQFIFYLIQNGEVIAEATNTADGNVTFEAIEYTTVGTYNYTVRELGVLEDGILYDESEFDIYVEVIDDTEGQLVATVNYPEDTEFDNVYKKVSVGDYVWIDENNDGLQDETDTPLEGIVLEITDLEGNPVTDVYGNPVGPVTTDENGHYVFENLPADKTYVVTINQEESEEALLGLMPTIETEDDRENDSSTWTVTSEFLPNDGDHDPTLDFGFVREKVSVGDYVWIDENNDGLQDETDTPLEGIVLEITDLEGNPVTDVYGNPVGPVTTDENGHYVFENLPADKAYVVTINIEESAEALEGLVPTIETEGNREIDSSTWTATSEFLPNDGDHDPTLDFGFTRVPEPTEPSEPTDPTEPSKSTEVDSGDVSVTGESSTRNISLIVIAMAVVVALILRRRLNKA